MAQEAATVKDAPQQTEEETYKQLIWRNVWTRAWKYVEPVTDENWSNMPLKECWLTFDPHSDYMAAKDFDDMKVQTKGEFGGLGIEVTMEDGLIKVISPIDDTPAFKAGVKAGDLIIYLDKNPSWVWHCETVDQMRGKVGTPIEITVRREGVPWTYCHYITYVMSSKFSRSNSVLKMRQSAISAWTSFNRIIAYDGLKKPWINQRWCRRKIERICSDLRNNPFGLLDQAIAISDAFLEQGEIRINARPWRKDIKRDNALPGDLANGLPVVGSYQWRLGVCIRNCGRCFAEIIVAPFDGHALSAKGPSRQSILSVVMVLCV